VRIRSWLRASGVFIALWGGCRPLPADHAGQAPAAAPGRGDEAARMVEDQLRRQGISDARVLAAMRTVPRHAFVPAEEQAAAYDDRPLPIGFGQTISQPYIVAFMTEALGLTSEDVVLEIGTGSGYQAAVLAEIAREVYTIELLPELADRARRTLEVQGYRNVHVRAGDGYRGWPEHAPFPRIIVTAAPEEVPAALVDQLAVGGTMVVPVGPRDGAQELRILKKTDRGVVTEHSLPVRFVPMVKRPPP
jgi:protein-L-isoaspartate(D-aspartate) O-methyltransferase